MGRYQIQEFKIYLDMFLRRLEQARSGNKTAQEIIDETHTAYPSFGKPPSMSPETNGGR